MRLRSTTPKDHLNRFSATKQKRETGSLALTGQLFIIRVNVCHPLCILDDFPCGFWEVTIQMLDSRRVRSIQRFNRGVNFVRG